MKPIIKINSKDSFEVNGSKYAQCACYCGYWCDAVCWEGNNWGAARQWEINDAATAGFGAGANS